MAILPLIQNYEPNERSPEQWWDAHTHVPFLDMAVKSIYIFIMHLNTPYTNIYIYLYIYIHISIRVLDLVFINTCIYV